MPQADRLQPVPPGCSMPDDAAIRRWSVLRWASPPGCRWGIGSGTGIARCGTSREPRACERCPGRNPDEARRLPIAAHRPSASGASAVWGAHVRPRRRPVPAPRSRASSSARRGRRRAPSHGRSRSHAVRCRAPCATTCTSSISCSARSTTSSTTRGPRRPSGSARSRRGRPGLRGRDTRGRDARAPRCAAIRCRTTRSPDFCAGHAPGHAPRDVRHRGGRRPLLLPRRGYGRAGDDLRAGGPRPRAAPSRRRPRSAWRCSARTSCATSTRTPRPDASTWPGGRDPPREPGARAGARRCCASRSRAPTRCTSRGWPALGAASPAGAPSRRRARCTARSCARSSATGYGAGPGGRAVPAQRRRKRSSATSARCAR